MLASATDLELRVADITRDWPRIWPLWRQVVSSGETHPYPVDSTEDDARALWIEPRGSLIYLAERGDELLAAMMTKPMRGGNGDHVANFDLIVDPKHWSRGVGRALATHVIEASKAAGYRAMEAYSVVEANERALRLWHRLGFQTLATVPNAFRHPRLGPVAVHLMYMSLD